MRRIGRWLAFTVLAVAAGLIYGVRQHDEALPSPRDAHGGATSQAHPGAGRRVSWLAAALFVGGIGLAVSIAGLFVLPAGAFFGAWLAAYICWLSLPLAALAALMIHDLTGGEWGFALRPILTAATATLPLFVILFLPIAAAGLAALYPWARAGQSASLPNSFYLNTGGFLGRAAVYFLVWLGFGFLSLRRAARGLLAIDRAGSWISGIGLLALAFSASFAAIDWVMSMQPRWSSSLFGLIVSANLFTTGFGFFTLVALAAGPAGGPGAGALRSALAHILLASVIFWAYCEFMQFLIVWEENLISEIPWYLDRFRDGWGAAALILVLGRFLIPFFTLIWRPLKRDPRVLGAVCLLLLGMAQLYAWLLVLPAAKDGFTWIAPFAAAAVGGACVALFLALYGSAPLLRRRFGMAERAASNV